MKQLSAKLKSRGATAVVLTLALGAAVYLNWSFSREAPPSLVVSDTAGEAVETSAQAAEPITVARKPLVGTVAANVLEHGTGALNIDGCRIEHDAKSAAWVEKWSGHEGHPEQPGWGTMGQKFGGSTSGRWPANVVLDEETGYLEGDDP